MFVGIVAGFFGLTLFGDYVGRKRLMIINLFIAMTGLLITLFCVSLHMAAVGLFLITCGIQNAFNIAFNFISETIAEEKRDKLEVSIQLFYGLGVLNVLWFWSVKHWRIIYIAFYLAPLTCVIIVFIFFIKDTPMCLITRYSSEEALSIFHKIARMNNVSTFDEVTVEEIT